MCIICIAFFLNEKTFKCEQPKKKINHCIMYSTLTTCNRCQYNYTPYSKQKKCLKIKTKN